MAKIRNKIHSAIKRARAIPISPALHELPVNILERNSGVGDRVAERTGLEPASAYAR